MPAPLFYFLLEYELRLPSVALLRSVIFSSLTCLNLAIISSKDIGPSFLGSGVPFQTLEALFLGLPFLLGLSRCCSSDSGLSEAFLIERLILPSGDVDNLNLDLLALFKVIVDVIDIA